MKTLKIIRNSLAVGLMLLASTLQAQYNTNPTLKIGDDAPPIIVQSWVKGEPIHQFEKGKVYVIDFWATWCGGCIASFPHISAVAEKYKGKVRFASIDSYEGLGDRKDEDAAVVVKDFLKTSKGQRLKLDVAVDDKANTMYNTWIKTLRRQGFPTTFIIDQNGKIAWVDANLDNLDWVLQQVLSKKWNNETARQVMTLRDALDDKFIATVRNEVQDQKNSYLEMIDDAEAFEKQFPDRKYEVAFYKLWAFTEIDKGKVPMLLEEMALNPRSKYINLGDAAFLSLRRDDLTKRDYIAIAKVQERLLLNEHNGTGHGGKSVEAYSELAATYSKAGNISKAIFSIQIAIAMAKEQKVPANDIEVLTATMSKYKSTKTDLN
ncbi:TlpA disulfide reductase family protein [Labilibaculum manganireducens]|uniref:TlpA family protein disulfide reductase n=1 Tax=Labilibaculum manganireducens TaxID=1940525 RepID=UPI0029F5BDE9|nr:TlpA disulfide reductase family protein [Labilibaculum manganireducens]